MIDTLLPSNHIDTHLYPIQSPQSWIQHIPPKCQNTFHTTMGKNPEDHCLSDTPHGHLSTYTNYK